MKNKKVVHGKLIGMRTITNINELKANMQLLDKYLNGKTDPEYSFAKSNKKRNLLCGASGKWYIQILSK